MEVPKKSDYLKEEVQNKHTKLSLDTKNTPIFVAIFIIFVVSSIMTFSLYWFISMKRDKEYDDKLNKNLERVKVVGSMSEDGEVINSKIVFLSPHWQEEVKVGSTLIISWEINMDEPDQYQIFVGNDKTKTEREIYDKVSTLSLLNGTSRSFNWNVPDLIKDFTEGNLLTPKQIKDHFYLVINAIKKDRVGGGVIASSDKVYFSVLKMDINVNSGLAWGPSDSAGDIIFNNGNIGGVGNLPTNETAFILDKSHIITVITNYHWNDGRGSAPGFIEVRDGSGKVFGRWTPKTRNGQGAVLNAYWDVYPNIILPPGRYLVIDSDPATWSQNHYSGNSGHSLVKGFPQELPETCFILGSELRYLSKDEGSSEDVRILQDFLKNEGYTNDTPDGFYGLSTVSLIKEFQKNFNLTQTGNVDGETKAKIEEMSCYSNYLEPDAIIIKSDSKCIDTDGGRDYYTKGTVSGEDQTGGTDYCIDSWNEMGKMEYYNPPKLLEYYCVEGSNHYTIEKIDCPNGCLGGACI